MDFVMSKAEPIVKYPGRRAAVDGNTAVILSERESSDAAGAYPITPSTQMGEMWAEAAAQGHLNIAGRPLIFIEPEGEHAAAAVTAGLAMTGLRAANFSSGQGIAYMHESLYAAVGKRLTYVLNVGARAMTKATLNVHAGHDDYHCVDDTGFFQMFAKNAQHAADLNIIAHRIAELALNPGIVAQDGFLTTHLIESLLLPERELIAEFLGRPDDVIDTPTPAQRLLYGERRRRIPVLWDVDNPVMAGVVQNQDAYMQSVAAQRPFFFDHIDALTEQAFAEFARLSGRRYSRVMSYRAEDADYLIVGQGSVVPSAEAVADYLRASRHLKVGVVDLLMFRPFPSDLLGALLKGKKGVVVLERVDQPLAVDAPLLREIRATLSKCLENGRDGAASYPGLPMFSSLSDMPPLYAGCFGLGSRDLQAEGLIAAVENMLPQAARRKFFYLGIDFERAHALTPKQELLQQTLRDGYPQLAALSLRGSENPNLMPPGSIAVRMHSVGGWGAITTGKNLALALFELLGYHIKANPKYGSEKKGQPTTYYLAAAPEPIRMNCEYFYVDVVLSPDPHVLQHTNALAGLKDGGIFIVQSDDGAADKVWASIAPAYQKIIVEKNIRVYFLDAFKIAREEATDPELELRMQGNVFQGAFFATAPLFHQAGFSEERLLAAIRAQLQKKFGAKGARVVEDNLRAVQRGYDELQEIVHKPLPDKPVAPLLISEPPMPAMARTLPPSRAAVSDIHRFWEATGSFYARGRGNDNLADPFISLGVMPASSALFRDMTGIRFQHPQWLAENCTGCGACYTVCPDTAIPGLVSELAAVLETLLQRVKRAGHEVSHLPRALRLLEPLWREACRAAAEHVSARALLEQAIDALLTKTEPASDRNALQQEMAWLREQLGEFQFALTRPYFGLPEKKNAGDGGLFVIAVNPTTCKGCQECVAVCEDDALRAQTQTAESVARLRHEWSLWLDLPNTPAKYRRIEDLEQRIGALQTLLLDKNHYLAFTSGDGACMGCSEKTVLHLFVATVEALMQPRVAKHVAEVDDLISRLERHVQQRLVQEINIDDAEAMTTVLSQAGEAELTLADVAARIEQLRGSQPIDRDWLQRVMGWVKQLQAWRWQYSEGVTGRGRSAMGILNSTGCSSVWGSTYPFNPYPFPWANHLFQDSPSMAMGVFEGHMAKMAEGFKTIRYAEQELAGTAATASASEQDLSHFTWRDFSDAEFALCPPVVVVGGDGAMYDIGFQNLSRAMMSGRPLKVVVLDTQVYSNTGGQACTSGFLGQISDMAPFGKAQAGKLEARKEIGLIGMAHRTTYVMQSTIAHPNHMIEGFIEGLLARRPALFNCYAACQPEHGIGDDQGAQQARLAVESRAYPLFRFNPDKGKTPAECFDLDGNPEVERLWPVYTLRYQDGATPKDLELPMTFADFALTETRFRKHFRMAPPDTWHENMLPLADYLELDAEGREGKFPFVWTLDRKQRLSRLLVDAAMVASCEDRRDFWLLLRALAGVPAPAQMQADVSARVQAEVIQRIVAGLSRLAAGEGEPLAAMATGSAAGAAAAPAAAPRPDTAGHMAPWLDSEQCTACGECIAINRNIFAYNDKKQAYIKNAEGGPYRDLVKAAERCTAQVIHPGVPRNAAAADMVPWVKRAEKFNQ
jgi:pyruvate-ferredoxin/flavodoxin oxidoreductase